MNSLPASPVSFSFLTLRVFACICGSNSAKANSGLGMNGIGRLFGALATVVIMYISGQHTFGSGAVGLTVLSIAHTKVEFGFMQAIAGGASAQALRLTSETALHTLLTLLCAPAPCTATD